MLATSKVLATLVERHVQLASAADRDCRLLVPGLTDTIARQIHTQLRRKNLNSYLVVGEDELPNESGRLIRAVALTSKRIGSFIAIASPGQLIRIQDSIRGTGGTLRSTAFSEEWPWIDNAAEPFRFDGQFLDALISRWATSPADQKWLREFIVRGLLEYTRSSSNRTSVLLEELLGAFDPTGCPSIADVRLKVLFHAGIPCPSGSIPSAARVIEDAAKLARRVIERCQKDEDIREQTRGVVPEIVPLEEQNGVRQSLERLLDGIGKSATVDLGVLAFHGCWGNDSADWLRLGADRLEELFGVKEAEHAEIRRVETRCQRGQFEVRGVNTKLATFVGEQVELGIDYRIPQEQLGRGAWVVRLLNRQQMVAEQPLVEGEGQAVLQFNTTDCANRYSRKVPLRIALVADTEIKAQARLEVHLCCEERPGFAIVEPGFEVIDATVIHEDETPDKKVCVDDPVHLYLFSHSAEESPFLCNDDEEDLGLIETGKAGVWRSAQKLDVASRPSGQLVVICGLGELRIVICFEANDQLKGEFTIEDELRSMLSGKQRERRIEELAGIFEGTNQTPYPALGQLGDAARRRIALAQIATTRTGWRPLLGDLLRIGNLASGSVGDYINNLDSVEVDALAALSFPDDVVLLLRNYADARQAILDAARSHLDGHATSGDHPLYASHPIFSRNNAPGIEALLIAYLSAYKHILLHAKDYAKDLEWGQLLVLAHLDCVVHWDSTRLRNGFFLIGPWHPLVVAKRFMVQAALSDRAQRLFHAGDGKAFRHLSALLGQVQGFRWVTGLSADDRRIEPAFVTRTSDPGWHVAFRTNCPVVAAQEQFQGLTGILSTLRQNYGLAVEMDAGGTHGLAVSTLASFLRAFPSRRSVGLRVRGGYSMEDVVSSVNSFLHVENEPTDHGRQLPGGVRLYLEETLSKDIEATWANPPLSLYNFADDASCIEQGHPDMYLLPPVRDVSFGITENNYRLPRGRGRQAIFSEPLRWLTEGQTLVPKSVAYEVDKESTDDSGLGGAFSDAVCMVRDVLGASVTTVASADLPLRLNAPWVAIPGQSIDPAMLVKYVRDGEDRALQERALWDYKLDLTGQVNSFFVLSTIPRGFQVAVEGFFSRTGVSSSFLTELGRIGIAIGGEALKSGRHALGVIGLVGAVRLMTGDGTDDGTPLKCTNGRVGFLVPVDSFASFFGTSESAGGKRTDLLAIQLSLPGDDSGNLLISACGVESKFVSTTYGIGHAHDALAQSLATAGEFRDLVNTSLRNGAMPERLALLELLRFGLRISGPSIPRSVADWITTEQSIYELILTARYEFVEAHHPSLLVSTEAALPGVAELVTLTEGLWVRLTKHHWPGVAETPQIVDIRKRIGTLFANSLRAWAPPGEPVVAAATAEKEQLDERSEVPQTALIEVDTAGPEPSLVPEHMANAEAVTIGSGVPVEGILIGVDDSRRTLHFDPQSPVDPLDNMNVMVTGSSGTGKTQFLKYLICQLREQGKNVLILDLKNDFADDGVFCDRAQLERVFVAFDGLPYNPLIPYPIRHPATGELFIQCAQHIAGVSSVLKRTYGLGAQQQVAVKNAIVAAFASEGISTAGSTPYADTLRFPDFARVGDALQQDNLSAYNRLDPLFTLELFREESRASSFHSLANQATVLDMSQIPSDEIKNALAQLLVLSAHAYYNSQPHSGTARQFLVFDEGHRVLQSDYMLRLVRECRAYGVGTIVSSQYPSDFPPEISASMATKIVHGNGRDSDRVKAIVQLLGCVDRDGDVAGLERFQAFVENRHYPHTMLRTMNYPLHLVWSRLHKIGPATYDEIAAIEGIDANKLPVRNLVNQLERLGLAEEKDGRVFSLGRG